MKKRKELLRRLDGKLPKDLNKIFFTIMPEGQDPDDYVKKNGKDNFNKLLKDKQIIQSFIIITV